MGQNKSVALNKNLPDVSGKVFVITGTIGFYSCYWFVWTIYAAIKVD